eukprot:COSAG06_NODE_8369_length_2192_cov_2.660410_1_plen_79_part_00
MSKVTKEILIVESEAVVYAQYKHREEELMVMFIRGATYTYFDVPVHVWRGLQTADSVGGFISKHIRMEFKHTNLNFFE